MSILTTFKSNRNFIPLFIAQFAGAFNDNIFKNALIILLTFKASILPNGISSDFAVQITGAIFILPFFLFSSFAGQLADYYEKSQLIVKLKFFELFLMTLGVYSIYIENVYVMWGVIFGLGFQATFFGPLKYSIIPQILSEEYLTGGNALIESGTFIAILLGTILGGLLIALNFGYLYVGFLAISASIIGLLYSFKIPIAPSVVENHKIDFNIFRQTVAVLKIAKQNDAIFKSILAISWFWFVGALLLSEFPSIVKDHIGGGSSLITLFLTIFSVGVVLGSVLCDKFSYNKVEIGLVPFGSFGMIIFFIDFCITLSGFSKISEPTFICFFQSHNSIRMMFDLLMVSVFGAFFSVPLYAFIQEIAAPEERSRIISANNILNALFMVMSAIFVLSILSLGGSVADIFWMMLGLHIGITTYIFSVIPDFTTRFYLWVLAHIFYRIKVKGLELVDTDKSYLLICDQKSWLDSIIIYSLIPTPIKFAIDERIFEKNPKLFTIIGAFPLFSSSNFDQSLSIANHYLGNGESVLFMIPNFASEEKLSGVNAIMESYSYKVLKCNIEGSTDSVFAKTGFLNKIKSLSIFKKVSVEFYD